MNIKTLYIFDLENVPLSAIKDKIELMGEDFDYALFFGFRQKIENLPMVPTIEILQCDGAGENYLDFQLVAEIGIRAKAGTYSEIIIVSNDKGFEAAAKHITRHTNVKVSRQTKDAWLKAKIKTKPVKKAVAKEKVTSYTKADAQVKLKFLIEGDEIPAMNQRLYNFLLHAPDGGLIRTSKGWKELIVTEFQGLKEIRVLNAMIKGGLLETYTTKRRQINLSGTVAALELLKKLK